MTRATEQPMASLSLGPAVAAPNQPVDVPPQVAVPLPPSPVVNAAAPPAGAGSLCGTKLDRAVAFGAT